jgi:hypothetical protein
MRMERLTIEICQKTQTSCALAERSMTFTAAGGIGDIGDIGGRRRRCCFPNLLV